MKFPSTTQRFIAYLDIMGFKDRIYREEHSKMKKIMKTVCNSVSNIKKSETALLEKDGRTCKDGFEKGIVIPVMFSDSILLVSRSNKPCDAEKTAYVTSYILYKMLTNAIPLKGAIAYGLFTADFQKSSFFGRPLVDAYELAKEIFFYGAILHNSFEQYLHNNNMIWTDIILKTKSIPLKNGSVTHSYIDWQVHTDENTNKLQSIINSLYRSVSGSTRQYVDNTKKVYSN